MSFEKSWTIWLSLGFWWGGSAIFVGALLAYLSESCPIGERSFYVALFYICMSIFQFLGYLVSTCLLFARDNYDWRLADSQAMLIVGLVACIAMSPPLWKFDDDTVRCST
jgi:MFS family permease